MDNTSGPIRTDSLPWMPLSPGLSARPLRFAGQQRTLQLKVDPGVTIARHRHTGFVHAYNVAGYRELSNGSVAGPGDYVYEPPGNEDSWSCVGDEPCIVQIAMSGRVEYVADDGSVVDYTDTPKLRAQFIEWCVNQGLQPAALGTEGAGD